MAMQHLENELRKRGDSDFAMIVNGLKNAFKRRHNGQDDIIFPTSMDVSDEINKIQKEHIVELDIQAEWANQTQRYIELGFHREIGLSAEDYLSSLPKFEPQPKSFTGRFDIPILVETRIAPQRQAELAGLSYRLGNFNICDWEKDPGKYKTPDAPYVAWVQDGKKNVKKSVRYIRKTFETDERGATIYDGIALWIAYPSILSDHFIDLPGTSFGTDAKGAPYIRDAYIGPGVNDDYIDLGSKLGFGSASCGRVDVTKG